MKILPDKKALLLRLREPSRVTTVIPTARCVKHNGVSYVAVPHKPDEVRVLRQLGFKAPDPMKIYYKWPGRFTPFEEQAETANFLAMNTRAFCLNSMGLGKTLSALWAYDYLQGIKQVRRALVVCPLSTMERTWADEIFRSFPQRTVSVLYGSASRRKKLLAQEADIYIINVDGLKTIKAELAKRPDIDLVIIDELALARNATTERWKMLNEVCNKQTPRRVWGLTGSPTPNEPTDAWAQCRLLLPTKPDLPRYFNKCRDILMRQVGQYKWVARDNALETVKLWMQPAVRYALDDVVDLPEQIFLTRDVELTPEQHKAYKDMATQLATELEEGRILAVNEAVKVNKLLQIVCGVAYGTSHQEITIPAKPRVDEVKETIEQSEGKVIVFVPFTSVLRAVADQLAASFQVAVVHGETPKQERDEIFRDFQKNDDGPRVLVANPGTMSHGLTLTAATTIVWFAPIHSNEIYEQACARVRRPGQTRTTVIVHIAASEVERRIYNRLKNKQRVQGTLLDMFKEDKFLTAA